MKRRYKLTRREKVIVRQAIQDAGEDEDYIMVDTGKRMVRVKLDEGRAILPSGKEFDIDAEHIC